jgi:hypothetical protein
MMVIGKSIKDVAVHSISLAMGKVFVRCNTCLPVDGKH